MDEARSARAEADKNAETAKGNERGRLWPFLKGVWAIAVSVGSLVAVLIAFLGYQDQHKTDLANATATRQAYADRVSFWLTSGSDSTQLAIRNGSHAPIMNVMAWVNFTYDKRYYTGMLDLGAIPACSVLTNTVQKSAHIAFVRYNLRKPGSKPLALVSAKRIAKRQGLMTGAGYGAQRLSERSRELVQRSTIPYRAEGP
jgi:hypothetical protein